MMEMIPLLVFFCFVVRRPSHFSVFESDSSISFPFLPARRVPFFLDESGSNACSHNYSGIDWIDSAALLVSEKRREYEIRGNYSFTNRLITFSFYTCDGLVDQSDTESANHSLQCFFCADVGRIRRSPEF